MPAIINYVLSFLLNFLIALIVVRFIYYPEKHNKNYVFTFLAFNAVIYFVISLLAKVELGIGVGFGLFAIFSVLRYRTDPIPIREMTYLFIILALPVMNSVLLSGGYWLEFTVSNILLLSILFILEKEWGFKYETSKKITYEKIDLIRPERRAELIRDLSERTGLKIKRVVIGNLNFLRDTAEIKIYFDRTQGDENDFEVWESSQVYDESGNYDDGTDQ